MRPSRPVAGAAVALAVLGLSFAAGGRAAAQEALKPDRVTSGTAKPLNLTGEVRDDPEGRGKLEVVRGFGGIPLRLRYATNIGRDPRLPARRVRLYAIVWDLDARPGGRVYRETHLSPAFDVPSGAITTGVYEALVPAPPGRYRVAMSLGIDEEPRSQLVVEPGRVIELPRGLSGKSVLAIVE
jgi:hypothetical protein